MKTLDQTHHLKFVIKGKPIRTDIGIKCSPRQTYGVSEQSPDQFKGKHTLIGQRGYIYKHQQSPDFDYFSQKKYYSIDDKNQQSFNQLYHAKKNKNPLSFHRKKGRLTQFLDKNGWMSKVTPLMGFQRSPQARQLQLKDRKKRINSLKPKRVYENKLLKPKVNQDYFETVSELMGQKLKIRQQRNQLADLQVPASARTIFSATIENHERAFVEDKMLKTARDWANSTRTSFYQPHSQKKMSRTPLISELSIRKTFCLNNGKDSLDPIDDFNRTTCTTKWTYKKHSKLDTDQCPEQINFK